ncbi:MAG: hypothetical protein QOF60_2862 [Actinomycetota bacterium]|nr:hypothetical protein [Actinomycetota bacterium]
MTSPPPASTFYSPPNEVDPSTLQGPMLELVGLLTGRLQSSGVRTVLPARVAGVTRWYGLAPSDREARLLREELRCWLGTPISSRVRQVIGSSDPVDQAALDLVPGGVVVRIDVVDGWQAEARSNVASLTDTWSLAPERGVDQPRPVGRVLRQFYEAVLAADRSLAEAALDEIRSRSLLNATNIRFLRVELLSALGQPADLRDDPSLRGISLLARPPAVTEHVAAAADALLIEPALQAGASNDWAQIAERLEEGWPGLVTHREQVTTLSTARCLVLREQLAPEPRAWLLAQVHELFPDDPVIVAGTLASALTAAPRRSGSALELYHEGDYWAALQAAESEGTRRSTASVALAAAVNIGDSASAVRALTMVEALAPEDREQLLASSVERAFHERLLSRTSEARVPASWLDWLAGEWADRPDLLAEWASQWRRTPEALDHEAGDLAVELLDALNDARRGRVRNGLPVFVEWLVQEGLPPSGVGLAATIFDILLASEPGRTERQVSLALLEEVLLVGCTVQEYVEVVGAVSRQLPLLGPRDANWLAQCLDLFLLFSSPDLPSRGALIADAAGVATAWVDRLEQGDSAVLHYVFADAGIAFARTPASETTQAERAVQEFRSVGIYSLLEGATRVAADRIRAMFPNVEVRTSSGHVNSDSLTALVRGADVILVQTSHAKHAATQAIDVASSDPTRLVLVHGRGATALVRALLAWTQGEQAPA